MASPKNRLKVLIVAAAAHPEKGSEPGSGWGWIETLSEYHDLWVIVGEREGNREAIEKRFKEVPYLKERISLYYLPRPDGPFLERIWPLLYYRYYRQWHQQAYHVALKLNEEIGFDLVHQLKMAGYREPGYLWQFNLPFVWGPTGGTVNVPLRFASVLGVREFLYHLGKTVINNLQLRYHKRVIAALKRADGFVTSTSDTRDAFLRVHGKDSIVIADTGPPIKGAPNPKIRKYSGERELRMVWSGLHVSRKALPLVLQALSKLPKEYSWHLDIIGQGPMTRNWQKLSARLDIHTMCTWHGWLTRDKAMNTMSNADIFVFPSLHEGMPTVVIEALSMGIPVICLDHCGQGDAVTSDCGFKIRVTTPKQIVQGITEAITKIVKNPREIERLSLGALKRSQEFTWEKNAQKMLKVYQQAMMHWNVKVD